MIEYLLYLCKMTDNPDELRGLMHRASRQWFAARFTGLIAQTGTRFSTSYKVADSVTTHEAWGLGVYSVFRHPNVKLTRAIEVPRKPGVRFHHMMTVALGNLGEISNVIDDKGGPTSMHPRTTPQVDEFP